MLNRKVFDRKRSWDNLRYYAGIRLERLREMTKRAVNIAGRRGRDLNTGTPECLACYQFLVFLLHI
jgi:hypothetical protein